MTSWDRPRPSGPVLSEVCPASPRPTPKIRTALQKASEMRERLATERAAVKTAEGAITEAEHSERRRMSAMFAKGADPSEDSTGVQAARDAHGLAERRLLAAIEADAHLQAELRSAIQAEADRWAASCDQAASAATTQAEVALTALREALAARTEALGVSAWLTSPTRGLHAEIVRAPTFGGLGTSAASKRVTGNREALAVADLLGFIESALDPSPEPVKGVEPHVPTPTAFGTAMPTAPPR